MDKALVRRACVVSHDGVSWKIYLFKWELVANANLDLEALDNMTDYYHAIEGDCETENNHGVNDDS